ncbi:MAG: M42 family metallopeptidase [Lachnospiraceae bacterium]|jgi:putative aminopeptidase FrvX|nr:M42 family metallopeptidase [Lachnospiraceae bacterium]MCI8882470.1 M42 family metallopeptidase [Lachnospiraceae bacterium]
MINLVKLERICGAPGISSFEQEIGRILEEEYTSLGFACEKDRLGSVVADKCKDQPGPKMMVAAHMDEVGFMVEEIDENGFLKVRPIGSWWSHLILGQWYTVVTKDNRQYPALMGSMATHGLPAEIKNKTVKMEDAYLDLGAGSQEEVRSLGVAVGDMVSPWTHFEVMQNPKYVSCKAFDDRIGNYIMLEAAKELRGETHTPLYLANTVQEEPGLRGARTAVEWVHPDIAFAIDTTLAGDTPANHNICALGKGVVLSMIDSNSIAPRKLVKYVEGICKKHHIDYQYAVFNKGGTDSGNIHKAFDGVLNMTLSIPIRYMHTNHSMIHTDDVEACIRLVCEIAKDMDAEVFESLL